jgi:O-methyltransferase involved in polyketide biosynthesis
MLSNDIRCDFVQSIRVFEVDQPDTQKSKRDIVEKVVPAKERTHVTFVPINFNKDTLENVLTAAGFRHIVIAMTSWLIC